MSSTWKEARFVEELQDRMQGAYQFTQALADERKAPLRLAAYALGIERVAEAVQLRGYI